MPEELPEELTDFCNFSASRHNPGGIRLQYRKGVTRAVVIVTTMKQRFYIYRRGETFYLQDSQTGKQQSLETKDRKAAVRLLEIKRQTAENPGFNQFILKSCITPRWMKRRWIIWNREMEKPNKVISGRAAVREARSSTAGRPAGRRCDWRILFLWTSKESASVGRVRFQVRGQGLPTSPASRQGDALG